MNQKWTSIIAKATDSNLGQTLIRLSLMAESAHRYESATQTISTRDVPLHDESFQRWAKGFRPPPVDVRGRIAAAPVRKEADR